MMNQTFRVAAHSRMVLRQMSGILMVGALCLPVALADDDLKVSVLGYTEYINGKQGTAGGEQDTVNAFNLTRGYVTLKKSVGDGLAARLTTDITSKSDGDWNVRLKYLYGEVKAGDLGFLTDLKSEIGLGHIPLLDFEESINGYRVQGTMASERNGLFNSADIGVGLLGNIGGKLEDAKEKVGNTHYDGLYGSWHVGVYNGAGYHAKEVNNNKVPEARLTLRPLPDALPGLQFTYFGAFGEGNSTNKPDLALNLAMVSYQHPSFTIYGQYFASKGNFSGSLVRSAEPTESLKTTGYSVFGVYHLPVLDGRLSVLGRYDHANDDDGSAVAQNADYDLYFGGLSYDLGHGNMLLVDYETTRYGADSGGKGKAPSIDNSLGDDSRIQIAYQLAF